MKISIPLLPILIIFVVLKLTGVISWPWVWVLLPLWGGLALAVVMLLVVFLVAAYATDWSK